MAPSPPGPWPLPYSDPAQAFRPWAAETGAVVLDGADRAGERGRWSYLLRRPRRWLDLVDGVARLDGIPVPGADPFALLAALAADCPPVSGTEAPFAGGVAGFLGYELAGRVERLPGLPPTPAGEPALAVGQYDMLAVYDHRRRAAWVAASTERADEAARWAAALAAASRQTWPDPAVPPVTFRPEIEPAAYLERVRRILAYIAAGDIFQANFTQGFIGVRPAGLDPYAAFLRLRQLSPAPFAAFCNPGGGHALAGASPERFIRLSAEGDLETRPIKGTRPRGDNPVRDAELAVELAASVKDRAENLMIADLMRNDLGRSAALGSVRADQRLFVESFARAHHLVSQVTARLRPGLGAADVLRGAFPGGSVTGAPKVRAMEIIAELEAGPRGPYCGLVLWLGRDGAMESSITIRSLWITPATVVARAGGGIVADSDPQAEYEEMRIKVAPLLEVFHAG